MANWPFRFVHASDFHLETPPFGVTEVPEHLRELFLEAAYLSAQRVFETALAEQVDFVVLSGDLVHCRRAGPRGPLFLLEQFERLAGRDIEVYWAGGRVDPPESWPPSLRLPANVHVFAKGRPEEWIVRHEDSPVARIVGASRSERERLAPAPFEPQEPGLFTIAVAHGQIDAQSPATSRVDYWALGGRHARATVSEAMPVVHYPGSPQGRQPDETGPHGCTLVRVDSERNVRLSSAATDVMRWRHERIAVEEQTTRASLDAQLDERMTRLAATSASTDQLVTWTIAGAGPLVRAIRRGPLAEELLARLRQRFGQGPPAIWSVAMSAEPPAAPPAPLRDQENIRGDFLRRIAQLANEPDELLRLESLLPADSVAGASAWLPEGDARRAVLREAAMLGIDLLSGEEPDS